MTAKSTIGAKLIESLEEFSAALKKDGKVCDKFTHRRVVLNLKPVKYNAKSVKATRLLLRASQSIFAKFLGVSPSAVRSWERDMNVPSAMACRFMDEIQRNPEYWRKRLLESMVINS